MRLAETVFAGEVTASNPQVIAAPFGGMVEKVSVRVGDSVKIGDPIAVVETTKVYAETDKTVSTAYSPAKATARTASRRATAGWSTLSRLTAIRSRAARKKAYNSSENRYIHIGESIYLKCTKDGSHQGRGIVTAIDEKDESKYTVEVTGGEFYMGETVDIYRNSEYETASRIGRGTVGRTQAVAVNGTGSVLRIHVKPGDTVERGELLFETVTGTLDGLYAPDTQVVSDVAGVVATVDASNGTAVEKRTPKSQPFIRRMTCRLRWSFSEADLGDVSVGGKAEVEFNWDADSGKRFEGTISSISYLSEKSRAKEARPPVSRARSMSRMSISRRMKPCASA